MIIGVPRGFKKDEYRVAMPPAGAKVLHRAGHAVLVEEGTGVGRHVAKG